MGVEIGAGLARRIEVRDDSHLHAGRGRVREHVSHSLQPEMIGIRDQRREATTVLDRDDIVGGTVHHEGRNVKLTQRRGPRPRRGNCRLVLQQGLEVDAPSLAQVVDHELGDLGDVDAVRAVRRLSSSRCAP